MQRTSLAIALALMCLTVTVPGQQTPSQPAPRFRTGVDLVLLDVSVLDEQRMPVRGLRMEDFTVLEDGRPQQIQTFSAIELPDVTENATSRPAWLREVVPDVQRNDDSAERRIVVLILDDSTPMEAVEIPWVKRMANRVIDQLGARDVAAVVYTLEKGKGQEFTQDRTRLLAAVDKFMGAIPGQVSFDSFDRSASTGVINTLATICQYLSELPQRRKAMVLVSVGLPIDWDLAQPSLISQTDPASASESGMVGGLVGRLQDLLMSAQRANVNIYSLDPGGLRAPLARYSALTGKADFVLNPGQKNREFLKSVSEGTGGFAVIDTNDYESGVRQVFRENGSYYLLGYASSNRREQGGFRKTEVRVNRPSTTVRARSGYYEPWPDKPAKKAERVVVPPAVDLALAGITPKSDLPMQLAAAPFAVAGRRDAAVALVLGTQHRAPARASRLTQRIDLRIVAFTPDGRQRASRRETVPITVNTVGFGSTIGYEILSRVDLAPGSYRLRVAAESSLHGIQLAPRAPAVALLGPGEDTGSKSGSVYCDLDVPDFANTPLSLSGVVLSVTPGVVSGPKDRLKGVVPVIPTTMREFARDDQVTGFLRVYEGGTGALAPVTLSIQIVNGQDAVVVRTAETLGADRFAKGRAADYFVELPIARLKRGPHLLTVEANTGGKTARRDVRFEVR